MTRIIPAMRVTDPSATQESASALGMSFNNNRAITHQQLRVFTAVAQECSFGRAAQVLVMTEPAVSKHIRQLEQLIGARLIERARGRRTISVTEAGQILLTASHAMFDTLDASVRTIRHRYGTDPKTVAMGAGANFAGSALPKLIDIFKRVHPDLDVVIEVGTSRELTRSLRQNSIHLAILVGPGNDETLVYEPFVNFTVDLVGPAGHRLAGPEPAPIGALAREDFIAPDEPVASRLGVARMAAEAGVSLHVVMVAADVHARLQAVANGFGITPIHIASPALHEALTKDTHGKLSILNVEEFPLQLERCIAYRADGLPPAALEFKRHLQQYREHFNADDPVI